MSGWPGPLPGGGDAANLLQLLTAVGRHEDSAWGLGQAPGAAAHSAQAGVAASAFHAYQRGPPSSGSTELLSMLQAVQFWSEVRGRGVGGTAHHVPARVRLVPPRGCSGGGMLRCRSVAPDLRLQAPLASGGPFPVPPPLTGRLRPPLKSHLAYCSSTRLHKTG